MCRVPATVPLMLIYLDLLTKPFSWTFIQTRMWREEEEEGDDDDFLARGRRVPRIRSELASVDILYFAAVFLKSRNAEKDSASLPRFPRSDL